MVTTIPQITQDFVKMIGTKAREGTYRVDINGIVIDVFHYIFPPQSPFSESTRTVYDQFGHLDGQNVLDIGTGTGIQAIQACLAGAEEVDAVDIYDNAVECAKHNVNLNGLDSKIKVWQSDLFNSIPQKRYDLVIANLPILDAVESDKRLHSLFDPQFAYHERLFKESPQYLSGSGRVVLCHANLQDGGFERLEEVVSRHEFNPTVTKSVNALGYEWRNYEFRYGGTKK
ncbi:50S ribosomal protein L11 methyltransferase [Candidatus Pacearchaeota archaeon]|nr:50S ribosomal protein L11 methyltransferase [Candidatus Pacearchaeota archaeon]